MRTCGLDIASCTGMSLVGEGEDRGKTVQVPKERGFLQLQLVARSIGDTLDVWLPDLVVIEDYSHMVSFTVTVRLIEFGTMIRAEVHKRKLPWVDVKPTTLKKWVLGKEKAQKEIDGKWGSKEMMGRIAKQRWGFASPSHDIVDAYCLGQFGQLGVTQMLQIEGVTIGL